MRSSLDEVRPADELHRAVAAQVRAERRVPEGRDAVHRETARPLEVLAGWPGGPPQPFPAVYTGLTTFIMVPYRASPSDIPTLSTWGFLILGALIVVLAAVVVTKKRGVLVT